MDSSNTIQLATQSRSVAQQLDNARAAVQADAPAFDVAMRLANAARSLHELSQQSVGQGLIFAPGQLATPDIPVFLRSSADSSSHLQGSAAVSTPQSVGAASAGHEQSIAFNTELDKLVQEWPKMVAAAISSRPQQ